MEEKQPTGGHEAPEADAPQQEKQNKGNTLAGGSKNVRKIINFLIDLLIKEKGGVLAGAVLAVAGAVGFWLSPLKPAIFHLIWNEDAAIDIRASDNVILGNEFSVSVAVYNNAFINISEGILTLTYPEDSLERTTGNTEFETEEIEQARVFPPKGEDEIKFRTKETGPCRLIAELRTRHGRFSDTLLIVSKYSIGKPTAINWSGEWFLKVGYSTGAMEISEKNEGGGNQLTGSFYLDSGEQGILTGTRDGETFIVDLIKENQVEKWHLEGTYKKIEADIQKYIEITGNATILRITDTGWKPLEGQGAIDFYATTKME